MIWGQVLKAAFASAPPNTSDGTRVAAAVAQRSANDVHRARCCPKNRVPHDPQRSDSLLLLQEQLPAHFHRRADRTCEEPCSHRAHPPRFRRFAVLVMLSSLLVRIPREKLHDDAAGGLIDCAGSAREARRKWAQALADTREAETRQPLRHLMAPFAAELPR
jgi:hypothetical protein